MKNITLIATLFLMTISAFCQTKMNDSKLNLDFEKVENGTAIGWTSFGSQDYEISIDSTNFKKGKHSALIEFKGINDSYKALEFLLPNNYAGNKIKLSGYIKTENVSGGYAGLWMRIDPNIAFDNMSNIGVHGTSDWEKYEITLDMNPFKTEKIAFGGLLVGKGKMWLDDLSITIDGQNIKNTKLYVLPAKRDNEFDDGSNIQEISINKTSIKNLKILGLIWGFLKYYHPNIAKGNFNWDYELFRILPKLINIKNNKQRDAILVDWIDHFGTFQENKEIIEISAEIKMNPDLDWITGYQFSKELTNLLLSVKNAKRTNNHYYVSLLEAGNPIFTNENAYPAMKYPDVGFRMLALYRYWNIIQYYFPYKYLIGEDWKNILSEFIPKIILSKNETEYTLTILELIARVNDTHANVWGNKILNTYFGLNFPPFNLNFIENKAVVTYFNDDKLSTETGLQIGDIITRINHKSVDSIVKKLLKYTPASNYSTKLRDIATKTLLRTNDTIINVDYIRDNKKKSKVIKVNFSNGSKIWKKEYDHLADTCFKLINPKIAYLSHSALKGNYMHQIWNNIKNTSGIILDCRYPPHYAPLDSITKYLFPKKKVYAKSTIGNIQTPGLFTFKDNHSSGNENVDYYKGKVVILVNEQTQSASEYHAMAYQKAFNSIVIGSTTAAADGNVSPPFYLPGKIMTWISGMGVYYPDGKETQRIGIELDLEIRPTIEGIKNGRDELIGKAIEIINRN